MIAAFDDVADGYDLYYSRPADLAESAVIFHRAARRYDDCPRGLFVDLGCGPGTALRWLPWKVRDWYLGLDPSEGMIEQAQWNWPDSRNLFRVGGVGSLDARSVSFILGGFGPIQYVPPQHMATFSLGVHDALMDGGSFLLMGRPMGGDTTRIFDAAGGWEVSEWGYLPDELEALFGWAYDLQVYGLRRWVPEWPWERVQRALLRLELLADPAPARCDWLVVEGRR